VQAPFIAPALPADMLDSAGTLSQDVKCRRCGYNLRGLHHAGRCPECGTPVGLSCHGDLLRFADPLWLDKLARGALLIVWGVLISIVVRVGGGTILALTGAPMLTPMLGVLASIVGLYGAWLLTEPDPSGIGEDRYVSDRRIVRFALATGIGAQVLQLVMPMTHTMPMTYFPLMMVVSVLVVLAGLIGIVGEFAKLTYFHKLALRIPDIVLSRRARKLRWAMAITLGSIVVLGGLAAALGLSGGTTGLRLLGPGVAGLACLAGVGGIAYLIVALLVLILTYRLSKEFRRQAQIARMTWAAAESERGSASG
jgi:hypothetical protein